MRVSSKHFSFVTLMLSIVGCATAAPRIPTSQETISLTRDTPTSIESLHDPSKIVSAVGEKKFETSEGSIIRADDKGNVTIEGAWAMSEYGVTGIMDIAKGQNTTVNSSDKNYSILFCVGAIRIAPNLTVPLSSTESIISGPSGALLKRSKIGKEIVLVEGEAHLLLKTY
jgi:hypothetical protein